MKNLLILILALLSFYSLANAQLAIKPALEILPTKTELVGKMRNRATTPLSYRDLNLWVAEFNRENRRCRFTFTGITERNLLDKLNNALSQSC